MADITIMDSGYLSPTNTGTIATDANRANSGDAITLYSVEFKPMSKGNLDVSPVLGTYSTGTEVSSGATINLASIENVGFVIQGVLDLSITEHQNLVVPLNQLPRTKWYKLLYWTGTDAEALRQLIYLLADDTFTAGEQTAFGIAGAYKHLHVMIESVQFHHGSNINNKLNYTITGFVTKKETSTI